MGEGVAEFRILNLFDQKEKKTKEERNQDITSLYETGRR